ncbi:hypothetical protein C5S32_05340 [ANME-1 cluster archaeon GoMg1]|nr:hypothetical protein [ANME-1 cluster archaeon GoMg1]
MMFLQNYELKKIVVKEKYNEFVADAEKRAIAIVQSHGHILQIELGIFNGAVQI